jgi:hypothetical protein
VARREYKCEKCGKTDVKLWREYGCFYPDILCLDCTLDKVRRSEVEGWRSPFEEGRSDQIGWHVACIPDEEGVGWWGYTSVPEHLVRWWWALPDR